MNVTQLVKAVLLKATGKVKDLQPSDTKYQKILGIANLHIGTWQSEPGVDWVSMYDPKYLIGTAIANSRSYAIDMTDIYKVSDAIYDYVMVGEQRFGVVPADLLKMYEGQDVCAISGETLLFARDFNQDSSEVGKNITVPVYLKASQLKSPGDIVPVSIPEWLVTMCAAEYVRNDILLQNQYPNLINEANALMKKMIENNESRSSHIPYTPIPGVS